MRIAISEDWIRRMAELEDGCESIMAGGVGFAPVDPARSLTEAVLAVLIERESDKKELASLREQIIVLQAKNVELLSLIDGATTVVELFDNVQWRNQWLACAYRFLEDHKKV